MGEPIPFLQSDIPGAAEGAPETGTRDGERPCAFRAWAEAPGGAAFCGLQGSEEKHG
jgi:hypothetical protein